MSDQLVDAPKSRKGLLAVVIVIVLALLAGGYFLFLRGSGDAIKIGVVGASDPYWKTFEEAAADDGIEVEIVDFSDYTQLNAALSNGELDLNQFQHLVFLADYNVSNDDNLTPIGATAIYPLALYSKQYTSAEDIPDGSRVIVPDDTSNQARGLKILQDAGLIELTDGGTIFSGISDVDTANSRVEVITAGADFTASSLDDVAAAIVNNDFVEDAGLDFDAALATDDPSDPVAAPYVNVFVARDEDKDNEDYLKLVEIYQDTKAVTDGVLEVSGGTAVLLTTPVDELAKLLSDTEKVVEENK
ncbi:MetQ/NlpA family ABC transporter substrate-binding protein [Aeromicrobium sp. Leaf350]|uniref:MetQ/NlpA family ABC transporter substrate-binding protein n=1 Tax=Aeromicrobium sp. Leaf350 TaxID=2876565 RepID=UPI001E36DE08|nr:MetQ/NlpA family ABC transporter substrate-binding protein [Aeromicrobium sp. Leaf350]